MLEKIKVIDLIEILENGCVQVREATKIFENGKELNKSFHRYIIVPGQDYLSEPSKIQSICVATHTPEIIAAYQASQAQQQGK